MHAEKPGSHGYNQMVKAIISSGQRSLPVEIHAKIHQEVHSPCPTFPSRLCQGCTA